MNPTPRPNLLRFLPLLFATLFITTYLTGGCLNQSEVSVQSQQLQHRIAADRIRFALDALKRGEQGAADRAAIEAVRLWGGGPTAYVMAAELLLRYDQPVFAARLLAGAVKQKDCAWDPVLWAELAKAYERAGNNDAVSATKTAADQRAATILQMIGQASPVKQDKAIAPQEQEVVLHFLRAGSYYADVKRDATKAVMAMREAHRLAPESPITQNALGYTLADLSTDATQLDEAIVLTERASEAAPNSGVIRDSLGWALFKKGDMNAARRILQEATALEPDIAEIHFHLGIVYAEQGLVRQAEIELGRALTLDPTHAGAQQAKAKLENQDGRGGA